MQPSRFPKKNFWRQHHRELSAIVRGQLNLIWTPVGSSGIPQRPKNWKSQYLGVPESGGPMMPLAANTTVMIAERLHGDSGEILRLLPQRPKPTIGFTLGLHGLAWRGSKLVYIRETLEDGHLCTQVRLNQTTKKSRNIPFNGSGGRYGSLLQLDDLIQELIHLHPRLNPVEIALNLQMQPDTVRKRLRHIKRHGYDLGVAM